MSHGGYIRYFLLPFSTIFVSSIVLPLLQRAERFNTPKSRASVTGDTNPAQLLTNVSIPDVLFVHLFKFYKDFIRTGYSAFDVTTSM